MSLVECVPNPKAVAASADFEWWPANGMTAEFVCAVERSANDYGSVNYEQRCPGVGLADECAGGMQLAGQAVGFRLQRMCAGRFRVQIVDRADIAFFRSLFVPMRERMMLWPVGSHDRYQADEANPERHHRDRKP